MNGERIWAQQRLRHGDEIRGRAHPPAVPELGRRRRTVTENEDGARRSPPRERDVLVVLCRPLLARDLFTEPASIREIAAELVVSEAAVKQHLANLYDKFEVGDG